AQEMRQAMPRAMYYADHEDWPIHGLDAEQLRLDEAPTNVSCGHSSSEAEQDYSKHFIHHQADDTTLSGSQGHADADLTRAACDHKRPPTVKPDHGEYGSQYRESAGQK